MIIGIGICKPFIKGAVVVHRAFPHAPRPWPCRHRHARPPRPLLKGQRTLPTELEGEPQVEKSNGTATPVLEKTLYLSTCCSQDKLGQSPPGHRNRSSWPITRATSQVLARPHGHSFPSNSLPTAQTPTNTSPTDKPIRMPETRSCTSVPPVTLDMAPQAMPRTMRTRP